MSSGLKENRSKCLKAVMATSARKVRRVTVLRGSGGSSGRGPEACGGFGTVRT